MTPSDEQLKRIDKLLAQLDAQTIEDRQKALLAYLQQKLELPCQVTGIEDFRWEEPYVLGGWDPQEYDELKHSQPSFEDTYDLLRITAEGSSEWLLWDLDLRAHVRRVSDGKAFILGLSELEAIDQHSRNYNLLHDYSVIVVNEM
jgi:hypothetical protein